MPHRMRIIASWVGSRGVNQNRSQDRIQPGSAVVSAGWLYMVVLPIPLHPAAFIVDPFCVAGVQAGPITDRGALVGAVVAQDRQKPEQEGIAALPVLVRAVPELTLGVVLAQ